MIYLNKGIRDTCTGISEREREEREKESERD